jgi:hypothetical protein
MDDFETQPVGTADLVKRLREKQICTGFEQVEPGVIDCVYGSDPVCQDAADRIEQLEAALTRANAATAAAYEVAAQLADCGGKFKSNTATAIRALATPDQTAALDKLIAEAVAPYKSVLKDLIDHADEISSPLVEAQLLLAASKKGGV